MSDSGTEPARPERDLTPGPTVLFGFNLAKIADHGEDSDPILRDGPDLGLIGVFDGMGGAGGTVYETPDGSRTGAYLASRIARDVVEERMLDLLEPNWNLKGEAAAQDLQRSVKRALEVRLAELKAPTSRLRSKLLRALPTTMAVIALQRARRSGSTWVGHVFWSGDSRAYAFLPTGARQLSTDDLRDSGDAMANLHADSVVSNAMSADTEFHVNYRRVELEAPFLLGCATDGCFGYVPSPMHFEHLVLGPLPEARSVDAWSQRVQSAISAVTGDDAAMSMMGVGMDFPGFQSLLAGRVSELEQQFIDPLDGLRRAVEDAEQGLQAAREGYATGTAELWGRYKPDYERHLQPGPLSPGEQEGAGDPAVPDGAAGGSSDGGAAEDEGEPGPDTPARPDWASVSTSAPEVTP